MKEAKPLQLIPTLRDSEDMMATSGNKWANAKSRREITVGAVSTVAIFGSLLGVWFLLGWM